MSRAAAFTNLKFDFKPPALPAVHKHLQDRVFTHPLVTPGKAQAAFEVPAIGEMPRDYENDAAIGHSIATTCILRLTKNRHPFLLPRVSKTIVGNLLSVSTLSTISDHYKLIDELKVPASADGTVLIDTNLDIRSQLFLAYISVLSETEPSALFQGIIQGIFDPLVEEEYKLLKHSSQALARPPSPSSTIANFLAEPEVEPAAGIDEKFNYVGLLQELKAKTRDRRVLQLAYTDPIPQGPDNMKSWTVGIRYDGTIISQVTRSQKKDAKNLAAGHALQKLGLLPARTRAM